MRVLLDTNVLLSYLLSRDGQQTVRRILQACFVEFDQIQLIVPPELITELAEKVEEKVYLREHIPQTDLEDLIEHLNLIAEVPAPLGEEIPSFVPGDADDDFLIVHGLSEQADFLVTGDRAVRALGAVHGLQIVTPAEFLDVLEKEGLV